MSARVWTGIGAAAVALATIVGCASTSDDASKAAAEGLRAPTPTSTAAPASPPTSTVPPSTANCTASLRPGPLPAPNQMPAGTLMSDIQARGYLIVGVDQNTLLFGYRNPRSGDLEGFDIDVAREVAQAIFGDPTKIVFKAVTTSERLDAVKDHKVDMVASLVTMRCDRWNTVSFSSEYYAAGQGLMTGRDSEIETFADLADKRVCATSGSTSAANIRRLWPSAKLHEATTRTECLVALQNGKVDAITADDTILIGLQKQDPRTTVIHPVRLTDEPYGLALPKDRPEFVRFVNGVLQRARDNGALEGLANEWLGLPITPPAASYQD